MWYDCDWDNYPSKLNEVAESNAYNLDNERWKPGNQHFYITICTAVEDFLEESPRDKKYSYSGMYEYSI